MWVVDHEELFTVTRADATNLVLQAPEGVKVGFTAVAGGNPDAGTTIIRNIEFPTYKLDGTRVVVNPAAADDRVTLKAGQSIDIKVRTNDRPNRGFTVQRLHLKAAGGSPVDHLETDKGVAEVKDNKTITFPAAAAAEGDVPALPYDWDEVAENGLGESFTGGDAAAPVLPTITNVAPVVPPTEFTPEPTPTPETPAPPVVDVPPTTVDTPDVPVKEVPPVTIDVPKVESPVEDTCHR